MKNVLKYKTNKDNTIDIMDSDSNLMSFMKVNGYKTDDYDDAWKAFQDFILFTDKIDYLNDYTLIENK